MCDSIGLFGRSPECKSEGWWARNLGGCFVIHLALCFLGIGATVRGQQNGFNIYSMSRHEEYENLTSRMKHSSVIQFNHKQKSHQWSGGSYVWARQWDTICVVKSKKKKEKGYYHVWGVANFFAKSPGFHNNAVSSHKFLYSDMTSCIILKYEFYFTKE